MLGLFSFKNPKFKILVIIAAAIVVLVVAGVAGYATLAKREKSPQVTRTSVAAPALVGRDLAHAKQEASKLGLEIRTEDWVSSKIYPVNHIVTQKPLPNQQVEKGSVIVVRVSSGKPKDEADDNQNRQTTVKTTPALTENPKPMPSPPIEPVRGLTGRVVVIDPGHQAHADLSKEPIGPGSSTLKEKTAGGATGVSSKTPEYKIALAVSLKLKAKLEAQGIKVIMTRTTNDVDLGNIDRAKVANDANAALSVRIHCDGDPSSQTNGISTLYPASNQWTAPIYNQSLKAARIIQKDVVAATKHEDNGVVPRNDLTGFNWSKVPVALVETGFLSNPQEDTQLNNPSYQDILADGISKGIIEYLQSK